MKCGYCGEEIEREELVYHATCSIKAMSVSDILTRLEEIRKEAFQIKDQANASRLFCVVKLLERVKEI